jgi:hypothetical protein
MLEATKARMEALDQDVRRILEGVLLPGDDAANYATLLENARTFFYMMMGRCDATTTVSYHASFPFFPSRTSTTQAWAMRLVPLAKWTLLCTFTANPRSLIERTIQGIRVRSQPTCCKIMD